MTKILKEILINDDTLLEDKIKAIAAADIDVINRRYEENENVTILHHFCMNPNVELVKAILARNPALTIKDDFGQTPLFAACLADKASIEIVKLLLNSGAKIDIKDNQDQTILQYGDEIPKNIKNLITETQKRQNAVTENLPNNIGNKIEDRSLTTNSSSESELTKALKKKNPDFGTRLENAADKEARERRDEASKVKATEDKYTTKESSSSDFRSKTKQIINFESNVFSIELIESLIADSTLLQRENFPQALLTEQDKKGNTLLHILSRNGAAEAIKILIELIGKDEAARESINTQNNDKQTSLDYAVVKNKKEVIDLLKIAGGKTGKALEIERAAQDAKKLRDEEDRKIEEEGRLKIEQERKDTENKERIEAEQLKRDEIENARLEAQTSSSALSVDLSGDPLRSSARKSAVTSYNSSVEDIEVCIDDKNTNLLSKTKSSSDLASNNYADFQARLREYHLHTTHSDNQNVCYNPQLKKELLGSDQNGVLNFHKTLGAQAEENRNKNYSKVPLLESPEKNSFSDYGLASQDALDNCTLKTFPLPDGVKLNMAIDKANGKVYLSKKSVAEIKSQGLTLSIKIPSKTGGAPEYLEFVNGVLHIVDTPDTEKRRIAGKGDLHELAGYKGEILKYSNQLGLTDGSHKGSVVSPDLASLESKFTTTEGKRERSNSISDGIENPNKKYKLHHLSLEQKADVTSVSFPTLAGQINDIQKEIYEGNVAYHKLGKHYKELLAKCDDELRELETKNFKKRDEATKDIKVKREEASKRILLLKGSLASFAREQELPIRNLYDIENPSKKRKFGVESIPGFLKSIIFPNEQKAQYAKTLIQEEGKRINREILITQTALQEQENKFLESLKFLEELKEQKIAERFKLESKSKEKLEESSAKIAEKEAELSKVQSELQTLTEKESKLTREYPIIIKDKQLPVTYSQLTEEQKISILQKPKLEDSARELEDLSGKSLEERSAALSQVDTPKIAPEVHKNLMEAIKAKSSQRPSVPPRGQHTLHP